MLGAFSINKDSYRAGEYRECVCCGKHLRRGYTYHAHAIGKACAESHGLTVKRVGFYGHSRPSDAHIVATMNKIIEESPYAGA